jgi:cation-transporting ATPase E
LTTAEVQDRLSRGQRNRAVLRPTRSYWEIVRHNVFSLYNIVLFASFAALFIIRGPGSAIFPAAVVLINVVLGLVQEIRAKQALDKLAALSIRKTAVRRNGKSESIPVEEIVRDDVIELHPGDAVPVDGPALASEGLQIDESQLTGESEYVLKQPGDPLTSGSFCIAGSGLMRAEKIGADSYVNHLSNVARTYKNVHSPLEANLDALVGMLVPLTLVLAPLTLIAGNLRGIQLGDSLENVVNLISSLVPQGLIVFVSISFAYSVIRISRHQALIQRPDAVELTGHIRFLCADKTGTLTRNVLLVKEIKPLNGAERKEVEDQLSTYLSNVSWHNRTVAAIATFLDRPPQPASKIAEVPFDSERKWSSVTLPPHETLLLGAPDVILPDSQYRQEAQDMAKQGMRVIALASSSEQPNADGSALPSKIEPVALLALQDELRPGIQDTLRQFAEQHIAIKIISGDAPETVKAIAEQAGMGELSLVTEHDLEGQDDAAFERLALEKNLFTRIKPPTKRRIIAALARHGPVAMIGDGVNDVPALKQANLAIAMNDGAQIAKDVSEVILLNNDFSTLPRALFEGREVTQRLYGIARINLVKVLYLTLLFLLVGYAGLPWPASLLQTTWLSLITLTIPAMLIIFRILPVPHARNDTREVVVYIVLWGMVAAAAIIAMDVIVVVFWKETVAVARSLVIAFAGLYNSLVLWDIYQVSPFAPKSFLRHPGPALAGSLLGLVAALAPSYLFLQFLGMAPLAARDLILLALALLLSSGSVRYLRRHPEHNVLVPTGPDQ